MISDLHWAEGRPEVLLAHARDVLSLTAELNPVLINLTGDVEVAVARAAAERGQWWVRRSARLGAESGTSARTRLGAIADWVRAQPHQSLELDAFRVAGWTIWEVDAMRPAGELLQDVATRLWSAG